MAGHVIGTFMRREMEMDADRYGASVAGGDAFEPTALRMRLLSVAREMALAFTASEWREGRFPDDFAGLVVALAERMPAETRAEIEAVRPKGSIFDTHPPDDRRIASAKAERAPGILRLEAPALLGEASPLPQRASLALYQHGFVAGPGRLHPLAEMLARHDAKTAELGAVERHFGVDIQKLEQRLNHAPYPFEHTKGALSIGGFVAHGLPVVDGIGPEVHARTRMLLDRLAALHHRALGRLAVLAERVERAAQPVSR